MSFLEDDGELRWEEIQEALDDFCSYFSPKLVLKLTIERCIDVLQWQEQVGVYLLFGEDERLLYIGYTLDSFKKRKSAHDARFTHTDLDLIVFPEKWSFFAPSLEVYLRRLFTPAIGSLGKHV